MNMEQLFVSGQMAQYIHDASLEVLAKSGCIIDQDECLAAFKDAGFRCEDNVVFFTPEQVDKALSTLPESFSLTLRDGSEYPMGKGSKTMCASGSPPYMLDDATGEFRFAVMEDFVKICKLVQTSDCIDMTHLLLCDTYDVPREVRSMKMLAALLKYTTLPISLTSLATETEDSGQIAQKLVDLIADYYGMDKQKHYLCIGCVSPISPLSYVRDALDSLVVYCKAGQPIQLATCSLPVMTSPASILGTLIQNNAELLVGITMIQLLRPGLPVIYGNTSTSTNLRNISMALGSAETALISMATSAMAKKYKMPSRTSGALNDAIDNDFQAGAESAFNLMTGVLSDIDLMYFSCGMLSGFNVTSLSKYVLDEQLIKTFSHMYKGIAWDKDKNYAEEIIKVGPRGTFMSGRTPKEYRKEHYVPDLFVKISFNSWQNEDGKSVKQKAMDTVQKRLESYTLPAATPEQEALLKEYV